MSDGIYRQIKGTLSYDFEQQAWQINDALKFDEYHILPVTARVKLDGSDEWLMLMRFDKAERVDWIWHLTDSAGNVWRTAMVFHPQMFEEFEKWRLLKPLPEEYTFTLIALDEGMEAEVGFLDAE